MRSFKSAFFRCALKDDTIDIKLLYKEAERVYGLEFWESEEYVKALEKEGFIQTAYGYAWVAKNMNLGSAYY